ncbi:MAG: O-antigen ligase family protein [Actinobacteria bacterium]|nr:O-antigen ligase family protein [Actinomycetota bacterium]
MGVRWIPFTLGAMVVAAVLAVDPAGLSPFGPARWWLVSTLGLVGSGLGLRTARTNLDRRSTWCWGALLALFGVSALVNGDVAVSVLGHPVRHLGLVAWVLFALLFAAGQQLTADVDRRIVLRSTVIAALGLGAWTVWELLVGPPVALATDSDRLVGPFGSAAILGAACCLLLPVCAALAVDATERRGWRIASSVGAATTTLALLGSGTRAAWIGIGAAAVVLVAVRRPSRRVLLAGAGLAVVALIVSAPRLDDVVQRSNGAASRLDEWTVAARIIGDHPVLGVGLEGYRIAAIGAVDADYERSYGRDRVLPDRAHSGPLDVAATGGLLAGGLYLLLVGGSVLVALRAIRRGTPATIGVAVAVIAYAVQQLLLFPLAELDPVWWLFAGMLIASTPSDAEHEPRRWTRAAGLAALALAPVALVAGVLDVAADRLSERSLAAHDLDDAIASAERAVDLRPDDLRYRSVAIELHRERGSLADIDLALEHADAALRWSPDDPIALDAFATLLLDRSAITGTAADVDAALDAWRSLVERDPVRTRWLVQLGRAASLADRIDEAHAALTAAAELRPDDASIATLLAELEARR